VFLVLVLPEGLIGTISTRLQRRVKEVSQ